MDGAIIPRWAGVPGKALGDSIRMQIAPPPPSIDSQLTSCSIPLVREVERMRRAAHTLYTRVLVWSRSQACLAHRGRAAAGFLLRVSCLLVLTACGATSQQRVVYQEGGIQVGIITDLSTNEHAMPPVRNSHPVDLTPKEIRSLIASLEVSGWS